MRPQKIQSLQAYRAIAAIFVVLYHITAFSQEKLHVTFLGNIFTFGYTGVDFFFVLSGFIIFYTHGRDIGQHRQLRPYLKRRFIRIFPIYWLVTGVKVLVILLVPVVAKSYEREPAVIAKSFLLIPQTNLPVIGAAWTLSYELFFYGLFAWAIWSGKRIALWLFAGWSLAVLAFNVTAIAGLHLLPDGPFTQFVLNERNLEFILGCLAAYLVVHYRPRRAGIAIGAGAIFFALAAAYVSLGGVVRSHALLFGLPSFLIVLGSAFLETRQTWRIPKTLTFLGDASYSMYLTHALFIGVFMLVWERLGLLRYLGPSFTTLGMLAAAIIGSCLLYQLVERPMLDVLKMKLLRPGPVAVRAPLPVPDQPAQISLGNNAAEAAQRTTA